MERSETKKVDLVQALFLAGTAAGGLIGGWVGDVAARRYPNHGRIFVTQFSIIICVPFSLLVLKVAAPFPHPQTLPRVRWGVGGHTSGPRRRGSSHLLGSRSPSTTGHFVLSPSATFTFSSPCP